MLRIGRRASSIVAATIVSLVLARPAFAVSVRDIIELSRAGLSDEILLALIETDKTIFTLGSDQLIALKKAGVSDRVIVAMLEQGRKPLPPPERTEDPGDPAPLPTYPPPPPQQTTVVVVPTPVYYPYPVFIAQRPTRPVHCQPGRIIGRTERMIEPVSGRWVQQGRTGGMVFMSDPICQ